MRENDLLRHIAQGSADLPAAFSHILVGPGDDCAVVASPGTLLLKVDQVIEGRHFARGTAPDLIARKAIARTVSDIAAMAGRPLAALAAAALPADFAAARELFDAAARWARHFGCPLVGGDIATVPASSAGGLLALSITVVGEPHATRGPVLRSGAQPGDLVYITGEVGGSFDPATGGGHHLTFEPRLAEANWLATSLGRDLHAMMDVSDGVGMDAARIAAASGVRIDLDGGTIPLSAAALARTVANTSNFWQSIRDGEDYELLLTAPPHARLPEIIPGTQTRLTRIGLVVQGQGCWIKAPDGEVREASAMGFEHA